MGRAFWCDCYNIALAVEGFQGADQNRLSVTACTAGYASIPVQWKFASFGRHRSIVYFLYRSGHPRGCEVMNGHN